MGMIPTMRKAFRPSGRSLQAGVCIRDKECVSAGAENGGRSFFIFSCRTCVEQSIVLIS